MVVMLTYVAICFIVKPTNVTLRVNETKVCKNSSISFTCKAKANPEVHSYQLHVNGVNSTDENSNGSWTKTMSHEGKYRYSCVANNSVGHEESSTVIVTVIAPVTIADMKKHHSVIEGRNLTLECVVAGSSPNVTWTHINSSKIKKGKTWNITKITIQEHGGYICEASNFCGLDRKGTYVDVECNLNTEFTFMIREKNSKLTAKLNDDNSKEFRNKDEEFKNKIKKVIPECHKHVVHKIELSMRDVDL
ncbi:hypothetical protein pdam_00025237 [Pocillopora damicornis]|uniref:Ig-like domain-containing protein n=1 Tax=Pocillopora damicornis TaxID=46731 RepID=A0A3M6UQQ4_POCDA|nr:hypothetical protein pdam_00025237 [Pocillopora damicornis]